MPIDFPQFRALIVDDEPIARDFLRTNLNAEGILCDEAVDGEDALEYLRMTRYDLMIIDLLMPNHDGHLLATRLLAKTIRPLIVIHTSTEEPTLIKDLMLRGVDDIIFKPTNYRLWAAKARGQIVHRSRTREHEASLVGV